MKHFLLILNSMEVVEIIDPMQKETNSRIALSTLILITANNKKIMEIVKLKLLTKLQKKIIHWQMLISS